VTAPAPRRVFLTGATGYIGSALAARLRREGDEVRALVRATSDPERVVALRQLGCAVFPGDVADRLSMRQAMSGADWVVHAAADLDMVDPAEDRMRRANVSGTENVASLAYKLGVPRVLAVSSVAAFGGSRADGTPATEETPKGDDPPSLYAATKRAGEEAARRWAAKGLALNVVWPSLVYGPPGKKQGANALLRQYALGRMPLLVGAARKTSWIYLEDLLDGLLRLIDRAPAGRDYLMTGEVATVRSVVERTCALAGSRPPRLALPIPVVRVLLALAGPLFRLRGRRPPASPDQLESLTRHWAFDDARARRELDWHPRPLDEGLPPTVAMFRER